MRFVIVTGVSGAGKTSALKMLEDAKQLAQTLKAEKIKVQDSAIFLSR